MDEGAQVTVIWLLAIWLVASGFLLYRSMQHFDVIARAIWERREEPEMERLLTSGFFWVPPGRSWWRDNFQRQRVQMELLGKRPGWLAGNELEGHRRRFHFYTIAAILSFLIGSAVVVVLVGILEKSSG